MKALIAGALAVAALGAGADQAAASYSGRVQDDTLTLTGTNAGDTLELRLATPTTLAADPETLLGGGGNDLVDGNIGADTVRLGIGADVFQWDPGDGSDTVEGEGGTDVLDFNASNADESIEIAPNGAGVRLVRNIGNVTSDFDGIEGVDLAALGGTDAITVNDVTGTALKTVDVDLSGSLGGPDGSPDTVTVNGTEGPDTVELWRVDPQVQVRGLAARTRITGHEPADTLRVQTLAGDDRVILESVLDQITPIVDLGADD